MIVADCRARITDRDLEFLVEALTRADADREPLRALATDVGELDRLLDSPHLFRRLLEVPRLIQVSPYFFFYVVVRRTFLDHGIAHRVVADYVGALLSYHLQRGDAESRPDEGTVYLVDLMHAMAEARTEEEEFTLQAEIGNRALFLAGIFPDWIYSRHTHGRRPLQLDYYEDMGRRSYAAAARSRTAGRHDLGSVLDYMAAEFPALRQALNDLVDEHLHLAPKPARVSSLCRQALYRVQN